MGVMLYYYLDVLCKQSGHWTHDAVAVEHGADQGPLLHQYCRDSVPKTEIIMIIYLSLLLRFINRGTSPYLFVVSFYYSGKIDKFPGGFLTINVLFYVIV